MFKNGHLRLLMGLVGMERLAPGLDETPDSTWVIPSGITSDQLKESIELINKAEFSPPVFEENVSAEDQLRRKTAPRKRAVYDDDDGLIDDDEDGPLFPLGGPTARKVVDGDKAPKKTRRRRRKGTDELEEVDDEVLNERARKRRERELAKARKIKSELYVHPSDDETDNEWSGEFMAREEAEYQKIQQDLSSTLKRLLAESGDEGHGEGGASQKAAQKKKKAPAKSRKRKSEVITVDSDDTSAEDTAGSSVAKSRKRTKKGAAARIDSSDEEEMGPSQSTADKSDNEMATDDTPLSSSPHANGEKSSRLVGPDADEDEDEDDEPLPAPAKRRPRVTAGFLVDSSDEE
jgi:replication fork protection complex subunit Tof1/Swi1